MRYLAFVLLFLACSDSKPKPPPSKETEVAKETAREIATQPRTAIAGKTGFLEFTIDLPPTASKPMKGDTATTIVFKDSKLELAIKEQGEMPSQGTMKGGPKPSVDEKTTHTVTEEPNGYLVVDRKEDATRFRVEYCRDIDPAKPPSGICCSATLQSDTPLVDIDKLITFGDQVCRSIKVTNR